ncbi:MAG TPA: hypothetical protein VEC37_07995 [Bacillota bacterium]|nr:hypothetical protein [Bacillota bacterium]
MKKVVILSLVLALTLTVAANASAAVHNFTNDFTNPFLMPDFNDADMPGFEGWYYIGKDGSSATARGAFPEDYTALGFEYFKNDQTFANLSHFAPEEGESATFLKGSYLFKNGFFAGLDYGSFDDMSQMTLSPGYRFDLAKKAGYVAVSMDYLANRDFINELEDSGIVDYEVNARYYTKNSRVYGQLIIPNEDVTGSDEMYLYAGGAYKYSKNIVFGANLMDNGDKTKFDIGCTTGFDKLGLEFKYENDDENNNLYFNALYSFTKDFRAGLQINKKDAADDPYLFAKFKYDVNKQNSLVFIQRFKNDSDESYTGSSMTCLRWDISF